MKKQNEEELKKFAEETESKGGGDQIGAPITPIERERMPWQKENLDPQNELGWQRLKIEDLPTRGLFYPAGTDILIRSATAAEIRHWSTLNEEDPSLLDDMINYVLERCSSTKFPEGKSSSWRDLKEVDRFYIILAIRERTFVRGENKLTVKVSENKTVEVTKEMIHYITLDDRLMRYYSEEERCFLFKFKNGKQLRTHIPSTGVTNWLKNYIIRKRQAGQPIDEDFINFAAMVIGDWRGLNESIYEKYVMDSNSWTNAEISLLTEARKILTDAINPVVKFEDDQGGSREVPLNFQGGIKSIFLISDPFAELV